MAATLRAAPKAARNGSNPRRPLISTHLELLSPREGRRIVEQESYPSQRPLRVYQVAFLRQLMECACGQSRVKPHSHFREGTLISFVKLGNEPKAPRWLINGRHSLTALGQTTGGPLWFQVEEIVVPNLAATGEPDLATIAELYQSYDRNLTRSLKDLYRADHLLHQYDLSAQQIERLGATTHYLATGFQQQTGFQGRPWIPLLKNVHIRFALMADWKTEMHSFMAGCQGPAEVRARLLPAAVLSIALVTYRFQPTTAHRFWPTVAADSGLTAGQPAHTLLRFLRQTPTRREDPALYTRKVAAAWNAFFEQRPLHEIQARPPGHALRLLGTPHDGTAHKSYLTLEGLALREPREMEEAKHPAPPSTRETWAQTHPRSSQARRIGA